MLLLGIYAIAGFWIAPRVITSQLLKRLPPRTHREVSVGRIQVNPFRLTLTVSNLNLTEPGGQPFASLDRFHADLEAASLWRDGLSLSAVELVRPVLTLERGENGGFNFGNLLNDSGTPGPAAAADGMPGITIRDFRIEEGRVVLRDRAIPGGFEKVLDAVTAAFTNLTTRNAETAAGRLRVLTRSGERIAWDGRAGLSPPTADGRLSIGPIPIPMHGPYLHLATPAQVVSGSLELEGDFTAIVAPGGTDLVVSNSRVRLADLAFQLPGAAGTNLLLSELVIGGIEAGLAQERLRIGRIQATDGTLAVERKSDGSVDIAQAIRPEFVEAMVQEIYDLAEKWTVDLSELAVERLNLHWGDLSTEIPVHLSAQVERLMLRGVSNRTNDPVSLEAAARWGETGTLVLGAEGTLLPASATAEITFEGVRLPLLQSYVGELVHLDVRSGIANGRWTVHYNRQPGGPLITASGGTAIQEFLAFDTQAHRDFLKWDALEIRGVRGAWEPAAVSVEEIRLEAPATSLVLMTNGQFNMLSLMRTNPVAVPPTGPATTDREPSLNGLTARVDRIVATHGVLYAADDSIPGQFTTRLQGISAVLTNITWPEFGRTGVDVRGFVGARAPFSLQGWLVADPKLPVLDMRVTTTNADLVPFTPYAIRFAGLPLRNGRITADVTYRVEGREVHGENLLIVDDIGLGARASTAPLLDLPWRLGIALLKDGDGRITLDIPVRGSLDDPDFGVRKVIWQAVKGLFVKAATAPFKLLGSLFGGSEGDGEALQRIAFDPGETQLTADATNRLAKLVMALNKRPELLLTLRAGASADDANALTQRKFEAALDAVSEAETRAQDDAPDGAGPALTRLFQQTLGPESDPSSAVAAAEAPTTPEMEQRLRDHFAADAGEIERLRADRIAAVEQWFLDVGRLPADRIAPPEPSDTPSAALSESVVEFSLE